MGSKSVQRERPQSSIGSKMDLTSRKLLAGIGEHTLGDGRTSPKTKKNQHTAMINNCLYTEIPNGLAFSQIKL